MRKFQSYIWLTCNPDMDYDEWKKKFVYAKEHGLTGIFLSKSVPDSIITAAKEAGLETHLWRMMMARPDLHRELERTDWFMVNRNGVSCAEDAPYVNYYRWLCPNHPDVLPYLKDEMEQLAKTKDVDGIHFDYIRYPDVILPVGLQPKYNLVQDEEMPEFDFCYCEHCRSNFKKKYGKDILSIHFPEKDKEWRQFRLDSISDIVNELSAVIKPFNKLVTAAVFPTPENARSCVRQDWVNWDVDAVYPMLYHGFYNESIEWIGSGISLGIDETRLKLPIFAGLYLNDLKPEEFKLVIKIVKAKYASGISIFNWNDMRPEFWKILKEQFI